MVTSIFFYNLHRNYFKVEIGAVADDSSCAALIQNCEKVNFMATSEGHNDQKEEIEGYLIDRKFFSLMPRRRQVDESYTVQKNSIEFNISEYFYGPVKKINIFAIKGLMENSQQLAGQKLVIESETMSVFSLSIPTYPDIR